MSTQPCGCDSEAGWTCDRHKNTSDVSRGTLLRRIQAADPNRATTLPTEPKARKQFPVASGVMNYFPDALVAVAHVSFVGNEQHNPGQPLHWAREKSTDQDDTLIRHFLERGGIDTDGQRHTAKLAWRALAMLQLEIEAAQKEQA